MTEETTARAIILRAGTQSNGTIITPEEVKQVADLMTQGGRKIAYDEVNHQITAIVSIKKGLT